jgi:hypothetical protein
MGHLGYWVGAEGGGTERDECAEREVTAMNQPTGAGREIFGVRIIYYFASRDFQRAQAASRALMLASLASGASPARMKPWPAPS